MRGIKLTKLKEAMGDMRPEELAVKTGLSASTIYKAIRGGIVTLGTATLIAQGMKKKVWELQ
jgi:transcriptional regulator with XRE-family HTH domain